MNNDNLKMPDDLFKQGLDGYEAPYNKAAWEDMRDLLDRSDRKRPFLLWFRRNKKTTITLITITMITTAIISLWTLLNTGIVATTTTANNENTKDGSTANKNIIADDKTTGNTLDNSNVTTNGSSATYNGNSHANTNSEIQSGNPLVTKRNPSPEKTYNAVVTEQETEILCEETSEETAVDNIVSNTEDPTKLTTVSSIAVNPQLPKKSGTSTGGTPSRYTTFRGPWIGIHFTMQNPEFPTAMDSSRQQAGFNLQFMSRNLIQSKHFGAYMGGDFGAQFYGRGKSYGVVLNNTELDSGFTRLSMHSFDFFVRGHFEYARFRLKPYVNGFAGPRIYATSQYTEAYHHKKDYENSDNTNAHTSASFMYGGAVGARFAISKHVSLDARLEYMRGTDTRIVDLDQSTFEGSIATFSLQKVVLQPAYYQFKFGVLFDLWDGYDEEEKEEFEPLNNEVTQKEYYYFDSATNQYIKVKCSCEETPQGSDSTSTINAKRSTSENPDVIFSTTPNNRANQYRVYRNGSGSGRVSPSYTPGGGSGGRGSFPGIKSGGSGIKIRN